MLLKEHSDFQNNTQILTGGNTCLAIEQIDFSVCSLYFDFENTQFVLFFPLVNNSFFSIVTAV